MSQVLKNISGWGNYPTSSAILFRPERYHQLKIGTGKTIARGLGRSYGDAALNSNQNVILMERLNRFLSFDSNRGLLRAEAGATLEEILSVFVPRGWFLPVTPGTKHVTLGGCIAADVHGKNHHMDGCLGAHIQEIELILADGSHRRCSPTYHAELFWATVGGMGLTGIISEATVKLLPIQSSYMKVVHQAASHLDQILSLLENRSKEDKYSVAWIDCLSKGVNFGRSILMTGHHATLDELPSSIKDPFKSHSARKASIPFNFPSWGLNFWSVSSFNALYYRFQGQKNEPFFTDYDSYFYPLDVIKGWNKLYGKKGFLQYQFVIPTKNAEKALKAILNELVNSKRTSFLAVLKRLGAEGEGLLSFPLEGYTLSLDLPINQSLLPFLDHLDEIVLKNEGRLYLAKDARMKPQTFQAMYPRLEKWRKIKRRVDPDGRFSSDLSRRLQIEGG